MTLVIEVDPPVCEFCGEFIRDVIARRPTVEQPTDAPDFAPPEDCEFDRDRPPGRCLAPSDTSPRSK